MTGTPFSPEGPGPGTTRPPTLHEWRYVAVLAAACLLAVAATIGIPWWLTR